jgi:hypothetical protein
MNRRPPSCGGRQLRHLQGLPQAKTLLGLGGLAYLLLAARPVALFGYGAITLGRSLLARRCGKRGG